MRIFLVKIKNYPRVIILRLELRKSNNKLYVCANILTYLFIDIINIITFAISQKKRAKIYICCVQCHWYGTLHNKII